MNNYLHLKLKILKLRNEAPFMKPGLRNEGILKRFYGCASNIDSCAGVSEI
jgi:hypothetical protein